MKHDLVELLKRNWLYQRLLDEIDIGVHAIDEEGKTITADGVKNKGRN